MFPPQDPNAQFDPRDPRNMGRYPHGLLGMAINHFTQKPKPFTPYGPDTPPDAGGPSDMFPDAASPMANRDEMSITGGSAFQPPGSPQGSLDQAQEDLNYATQFEGMARGGIITKPTVARLGERGPEAVVPLTPRAGNHLQPDLLEGHITEPKVPGMKLSRYKSFVNRDF